MASSDDVRELTRKLDELLARSPDGLDADDREKIKRLILILDRVESLGWFAKWAFYALMAAGAIIANWERIQEWWKG